MLRQIKPRNKRAQRALEAKAPKTIENPKTCLFLRGTSCSQVVQDAMADLYSMRVPLAKKFTKKNPIHPFEDASSLEFFSEKNDASLFVFGSTSKKRPSSLTLVRTFGHKLLDMLELSLNLTTFRRISDFPTAKFVVGMRPLLVFAGPAFESPVSTEFTLAKSLLTDFFRGDSSPDKIDVSGMQYVVVVTATEDNTASAANGDVVKSAAEESTSSKGSLALRVYAIRTKRGQKNLPRVEVDEIGPRMDFALGRMRDADPAMLKEAMKTPRGLEERTKKNISTDAMGDKIGRVHLGKQDLAQLQTRKMKGLKRHRDVESGGEDDDVDVIDDEPRRKKKA